VRPVYGPPRPPRRPRRHLPPPSADAPMRDTPTATRQLTKFTDLGLSQVHDVSTVSPSGRSSFPPSGGIPPDTAESRATPWPRAGDPPNHWGESHLSSPLGRWVGRLPARTRQLTR
jgi:hypothetical protein